MKQLIILLILIALTLLPADIFAEDAVRARKLINSQGCKACHTLEGDGGSLSVSFETMREKLSRSEIRAKLVNAEKQHGNAKTGDFSHLGDDNLNVLIDFIQPQP